MEHWETVDGQLDSKEMVANDVSSTLKVALFGGEFFQTITQEEKTQAESVSHVE